MPLKIGMMEKGAAVGSPAPAIPPKPKTPDTKPSMCMGCPGSCCHDLTVELTTYDMFRIVLAENRTPEEFVTVVFAAPDDAFAFRCDQGMVKLKVRQVFGKCVFFRPLEKLKCSIEGSKPAICLCYPFAFQDGKPYLRFDVLCPPENRQRVDYEKMSAKALEDCDWEARRYIEIINDWNLMAKGDESVHKFLHFAAKEMQMETTPWGSVIRSAKRRIRHWRYGFRKG